AAPRTRASTGPGAEPRARRSTLGCRRRCGLRVEPELRGALEHVERLFLAAGPAQHPAPSLTGQGRLAPAPLLREQIDGAAERLVRALQLVLECQALAERRERRAGLGGIAVAEQLDRLAREPDARRPVARQRGGACPVGGQRR